MREFVSVIVPTYNRPDALRACLTALARSSYPREGFEVIVVDDGGSVDLDPVITALPSSLALTLAKKPNGGPASARNAGAALAKGPLLAFTDDDCMPEPDWVDVIARHAAERPGHLIGGHTINALDENPFSTASQHLVSYLYEYSLSRVPGPRWRSFFASNNMAVPTEEFARLGGFDTEFPLAAGEDRDFCDRWAEQDLAATFAPDARVLHAHSLTASSFWRQQWNYGRGAFRFHQARSRRGARAFRPEPLSFYLGLLAFPLRREPPLRGARQAALLAVSQVANVLGYLHERRRNRAELRAAGIHSPL